jgi:hypothetical protein
MCRSRDHHVRGQLGEPGSLFDCHQLADRLIWFSLRDSRHKFLELLVLAQALLGIRAFTFDALKT